MSRKRILILGSTGSIGTQALEVIREENDVFEVVGLSANTNEKLLKKQIREFDVPHAVLAKGETAPLVKLVENVDADLVLVAVTGESGLKPTLAAIRSSKNIALANKETLVMDGAHVMQEAQQHGVEIIPVDSEHSALFQCMGRAAGRAVERLILTCSGGPFLHKTPQELTSVTAKDALAHPTWNMGPKITIDSATWVNKGFEIIEAHHLFGFDYDHIDVTIHPQSQVHGMIQFTDGSILAHVSPPDMKLPIRYALHYPTDIPLDQSFIEAASLKELRQGFTFLPPEHDALKGIQIGYQVGRQNDPTIARRFVHANDAAVHNFLNDKIKFLEIYAAIISEISLH